MPQTPERAPRRTRHRRSASLVRCIRITGRLLYYDESNRIECERIMTGMHDELDFERRLWDYAQGAQDADVERHVVTCGACRDDLVALRSMVQLRNTAGGALVEPPATVTRQEPG